jgi:ubiquitin-like 1-activating enzyme E1 A
LITVKALGNEVAKNLVLAGIGSLTIVDHAVVTEADLGAQFFLSAEEGHLGMNRAEAASSALRRLNPRVQIFVDSEDIRAKGPTYFLPFHVVIATDLDPDSLNVINTAARINSRPFYAAGTHGMYGFIFSDLILHDYVIKRDASNVTTELKSETKTRAVIAVDISKEGDTQVEHVTKRELYSTWFLASDAATLPEEYTKSKRRLRAVTPTLSCLRALWEFQQLHSRLPNLSDRELASKDLPEFTRMARRKHSDLHLPDETLTASFLRSFLQNVGSEISPVAAILGGQLAQDVINVLGRTQQPIQNMVIFDGNTMEASMYPLHPEGPLGAALLPASAGVLNDVLSMAAVPDPAMTAMMGLTPVMDMSGNGIIMPVLADGIAMPAPVGGVAMPAPADTATQMPAEGSTQ